MRSSSQIRADLLVPESSVASRKAIKSSWRGWPKASRRRRGSASGKKARFVSAERKRRDQPLDPRRPVIEDPTWNEVVLIASRSVPSSFREESRPGIAVLRRERSSRIGSGEVLANRVALVAVHPTLALLEVDWVRGQVPMHDRVAVEVEVQTLPARPMS